MYILFKHSVTNIFMKNISKTTLFIWQSTLFSVNSSKKCSRKCLLKDIVHVSIIGYILIICLYFSFRASDAGSYVLLSCSSSAFDIFFFFGTALFVFPFLELIEKGKCILIACVCQPPRVWMSGQSDLIIQANQHFLCTLCLHCLNVSCMRQGLDNNAYSTVMLNLNFDVKRCPTDWTFAKFWMRLGKKKGNRQTLCHTYV